MFTRWLATCLAAAQLFAVAHLALVPHTSSSSGGIATSVFVLEQHLDAATHLGPHAHTPATPKAQGEEHCAVLGLLRASNAAPISTAQIAVAQPAPSVASTPADHHAASRRELLLSAPKASPPA